MIPMNMMNRVVQYQGDDDRAPLPPVEQMVNDAEARIARQEERLNRISVAVAQALENLSAESLAALNVVLANLIADDPNGALRPQIENIQSALNGIGEMNFGLVEAVERSNEQLSQKIQLHRALETQLASLKYTVKHGVGSRSSGILNQCSPKFAAYAANS